MPEALIGFRVDRPGLFSSLGESAKLRGQIGGFPEKASYGRPGDRRSQGELNSPGATNPLEVWFYPGKTTTSGESSSFPFPGSRNRSAPRTRITDPAQIVKEGIAGGLAVSALRVVGLCTTIALIPLFSDRYRWEVREALPR